MYPLGGGEQLPAVPGVSGEERSQVQTLRESQQSSDIPSHVTPPAVAAWDVAAESKHETKVPLAMQHLLYSAYADAHMRTRLAEELVPLQRIFGMLLLGPRGRPPASAATLPDESSHINCGREESGTGEESSSRRRHPSWWKLLGVQGWFSIIACLIMCVNMARALSYLGHIGSASFPWVDSLVQLLWTLMCSLTAMAFLFGGGLERLVCDLLKDLQEEGLNFTADSHIMCFRAKLRKIFWLGCLISLANLGVLVSLYYAESLGAAPAFRMLTCYPIIRNENSGACLLLQGLMVPVIVQVCFYWILIPSAFMLVCFAYKKAYDQLAAELASRLRWCLASEVKRSTQDVVVDLIRQHRSLDRLVAKASQRWKWIVTATVSFDLPLITFIIYHIIYQLQHQEERPIIPIGLGSSIFWMLAGFVHLLVVALSAANVTLGANELGRNMLLPEIQDLLKDRADETRNTILVFNKYLDEFPPSFQVLYIKINMELVGSLMSLILGYVIVLATL